MVYDELLFGFGKSILGTFTIDMARIHKETKKVFKRSKTQQLKSSKFKIENTQKTLTKNELLELPDGKPIIIQPTYRDKKQGRKILKEEYDQPSVVDYVQIGSLKKHYRLNLDDQFEKSKYFSNPPFDKVPE